MSKQQRGDGEYLESAACEQSLRPFLAYLMARHEAQGGVTELCLGPSLEQASWCGYFRPGDLETAVSLLAPAPRAKSSKHPRIGEAVVAYNPQPVSPELYDRAPGKFRRCEPAGQDDVVAHSMFSVRIGPVLPGTRPASDEEREHARPVAQQVAAYLKQRGVSLITIDAGDWFEVLVPTTPDLCLEHARSRSQDLIYLLASLFSTGTVQVQGDPGAPRPLPGTLLHPGAPPSGRPQRHVQLLRATFPDDADLFCLMADVPIYYEPDDPPDEANGPAVRKPRAKKKLGAKAGAKAAASPSIGTNQPAGAVAGAQLTSHAKPAPVAAWDATTAARVLGGVLQRSGLAFRPATLGGDQVYQLEACPVADGEDDDPYGCGVAVRADGSFTPRCRHEAHIPWKDFKKLISWAEHVKSVIRELGVPPRSLPYRATDSGLVYLLRIGKRVESVPLSNFLAWITRDVEEDDGVETRHTFEVEATLDGQTTRFDLPASQFAAMNWPVEHLGARAVVHARGSKSHLRAAIQLLSENVSSEKVYKHTGWRQHGGRWIYLHAGGAIGEYGAVPGVRVELPEQLCRYRLPAPPEGAALRDAVRASLRILDVAPDAVTVPLCAGVWRGVLGPTDFGTHLVGESGSGKTTLAALLQQHWGAELDAQHLPATWLSTANANELLAFTAKDALLTVDDFVPLGGKGGSARQHQEADRLFRGQSNSAGRGRLRSDATLQPPKPPRGMILSTGEETPRGQSLRARLLVVKLGPGVVDWEKLTGCQKDAAQGLYGAALSGFLQWLAPRLEQIRQEMPARLAALREMATRGDLHKRTPGVVANLYLGLELFAEFAVAAKAMTQAQSGVFLARCWAALGEVAAAQTAVQGDGDAAQRFLNLLRDALADGKAHVAGPKGDHPEHPERWGWRTEGEAWSASGPRVGWLEGSALYLDPDAALGVARLMAQGSEPLTVASKTLHKRLHAGGYLAQVDERRGRLLVRKTLAGQQREVLHLAANAVVPQPQGP